MVWAGGLLVYVVAVFQRFSMSVTGVAAVEHLGLTAATLSVLAVVQVAVYASVQIPAGIAIDRYGYRGLMLLGAPADVDSGRRLDGGDNRAPTTPAAALGAHLRVVWAEPGTRLGFWTHFTTQFPAVAFLLLWGYPFLTVAEGLRPQAAGAVLTSGDARIHRLRARPRPTRRPLSTASLENGAMYRREHRDCLDGGVGVAWSRPILVADH